MRILVADDEPEMVMVLEALLKREHYSVDAVYNGQDALDYGLEGNYACIVLDIMMPKLDGIQVLQALRAKQIAAPVLLLTAKSQVEDRVAGLENGADDYLPKPFDSRELLARITVHLRAAAAGLPAVLEAGPLRLDPAAHSAAVEGIPVRLTKTEYAILKLFLQNPGQAIAKSVILDRISADTPDCTESSLKIHVSNLRKKLRDVAGRDFLESVWGIGFKLNL